MLHFPVCWPKYKTFKLNKQCPLNNHFWPALGQGPKNNFLNSQRLTPKNWYINIWIFHFLTMIPCTDQGTLQYSSILPTKGPLDQGLDPKHLLRMRIEWWILKKGAKNDMVKCDLTIIGFYTLQSQNTSFRILQIQNLQKHNLNTFYRCLRSREK